MRYIVTAQLETQDTDPSGVEWTGSHGIPAFEVVAGNLANAESIALLILGPAGERPGGVEWHLDIEEIGEEGLTPGDEEPRTFAILALHADVVREDAQWSGYDDESEDITDRARIYRLEGLVERLAAQVSELALRLANEA